MGRALKPWWIGALASGRVKDRLWRPRRGGATRRPWHGQTPEQARHQGFKARPRRCGRRSGRGRWNPRFLIRSSRRSPGWAEF